VLAVGNCCYVAVCSAARRALAPTEGGEGRGISWRPPAYSLYKQAVRKAATICPRPLQVDLLTLKVVFESRVRDAFLGVSDVPTARV